MPECSFEVQRTLFRGNTLFIFGVLGVWGLKMGVYLECTDKEDEGSTVERIRHMEDSQGQILALAQLWLWPWLPDESPIQVVRSSLGRGNRGTWIIRNSTPLGPYGGPRGGGRFL